MLPAIGDSFRVIGVCLALLSAYLIWGPKPRPLSSVKKYIAAALFFEGIFFLFGSPANIILTVRITSTFLSSFAYLLQSLLVSSLLIVLSFKVWRTQETGGRGVLKWTSVVAIGYLVGIWFVNVFKWFSMAQSGGIELILSGITSLGFLNSIIILSMSLILAAAGAYILSKKDNRRLSKRLIALSLIMLGLHFAFYMLYSAIAPNAWRFVLLTEIWPIALLGLGLSMLWS